RPVRRYPTAGARAACAATLAVACGAGLSRPARAELTLSVAKDKTYGIFIQGAELVKGTTETNPIRLDYGSSQARMNQNGSNIRFFFSLGAATPEARYIETFSGENPSITRGTSLSIIIGGTSGEAIGTPVSLTLSSTFIGNRGDVVALGQTLDGRYYDSLTEITFTNYKVGDTFTYLAFLDTGSNVIQESTLSVAPARVGGELPATAPEPSSLLLLLGASVFAGGALLPRRRFAVLLLLLMGGAAACQAQTTQSTVREIPLRWPGAKTAMPGMAGMPETAPMGSTHEIIWDRAGGAVWVTGQNYDSIAKIAPEGNVTYFPLPKGSGPHGMGIDRDGRLWVTFEFSGKVARLSADGKIAEEIDVRLHARGANAPINTHPHGLAL
ncbi:MAG: hypothetical protein V4671_18510, partial [Armatimonadota bacterium]